MSYTGTCHCGTVSFTVDADAPKSAVSCNCSHCRRKGFLLTFVTADRFTLNSGGEALRPYTFNKHKIRHMFCEKCGTEPFAYGNNPDGSEVRAVNLRCVPGIDLDALELQKYDGASS